MPDRCVDAFGSRVLKTVLARHYTGYLPIELKRAHNKVKPDILNWFILATSSVELRVREFCVQPLRRIKLSSGSGIIGEPICP